MRCRSLNTWIRSISCLRSASNCKYAFAILSVRLIVSREYYFSIENLCKDLFLRKHMDSQGLVLLSLIAGFKKINQLTTDLDMVKRACLDSRQLAVFVGSDGKDRVRREKGWEQWVVPKEDRDASAQNDGPAQLFEASMPTPQPYNVPTHFQLPATAPPFSPEAIPNEVAFPTTNGANPSGATSPTAVGTGSDEGANQSNKSPDVLKATMNGIDSAMAASETSNHVPEPDAYPNDKVSGLKVMVNKSKTPHQPSSRPQSTVRPVLDGTVNGEGSADANKIDATPGTEGVNGLGTQKRSVSERPSDEEACIDSN